MLGESSFLDECFLFVLLSSFSASILLTSILNSSSILN